MKETREKEAGIGITIGTLSVTTKIAPYDPSRELSRMTVDKDLAKGYIKIQEQTNVKKSFPILEKMVHSNRTRSSRKNKNEQMKKSLMLKAIGEDEELHEGIEDTTKKLDLRHASNFDVLILDAANEIEKRKEKILSMAKSAKRHLKHICSVKINGIPKALQDMTLEELERQSGFDIVASTLELCREHELQDLNCFQGQKRPLNAEEDANGFVETPAPNQTKKSLFDGIAMTPAATTVRKQRRGERVTGAALVGLSENGSPIEIDIESEVAAMTIAATVKQKKRRINVFGDSTAVGIDMNDPLVAATAGGSLGTENPVQMPNQEELANMDPGLRAQINHYYQIFVGQIGQLMTTSQGSK